MTPLNGDSAGCVTEPVAVRPVVHIPTKHQVVRASLTSSGWIGLIQRRRQFGTVTVSTLTLVHLPEAIIVDGSVLGHLPALALKGGHFETRWSKAGRLSTPWRDSQAIGTIGTNVRGMRMMVAKGKPTGMTEVALRLFEKAEAMPNGPRECLKALIPYLAENISICLEASQQLGSTPDLSRPIEDIVSAAHQTIMPKRKSGEATRAAWLFLEATQRTFQVLDLTQAGEDQTATFIAAMGLGQADVRLAQVWSGLWDIMAVSDANAAVAEGIAKVRKAGGARRGQAIAAKAKAWKAEALEIALARDAKHPPLNRQQLVMFIMDRIEGETVPNFKTVETWLRQEAEQPHGPVGSRARRKPA